MLICGHVEIDTIINFSSHRISLAFICLSHDWLLAYLQILLDKVGLYRVTYNGGQLLHFVDLKWCQTAMPFLPTLHLPKKKRAESGTTKS